MKDRILSDLSNYMSLGKFEKGVKLLKEYPDSLDVMYKDGIFFRFAILEGNINALNNLLQYYEKTQLKGDSNSLEYKVAKNKLQTVLQDAVSSFDISEETQVVLDKYLPKEEDSDRELDDLEDIQIPYFPNNYASAELTEDNLKILDNHHEKGLDLAGKNEHLLDIY